MKQAPEEKGKCVAWSLVLETCEMNIINRMQRKKQHWRDVKDACFIVLKSCLLKLTFKPASSGPSCLIITLYTSWGIV